MLSKIANMRLPVAWSALALFAVIVAVMAAARPVWTPPPAFDAYGYMAMAEDPFHERASLRQQQRLFPAVVVHLVSRTTGLGIPESFRLVANVGFVAFAALLYVLLLGRRGCDGLLGAALAIQVLLLSWPITYNLSMIYQVSDMLTYVFTAALWLAMVRQRWVWVWILGVGAALTRQNLVVLALAGVSLHLWTLLRGMLRRRRTDRGTDEPDGGGSPHPGIARILAAAAGVLCLIVGAVMLGRQHESPVSRLVSTDPESLRAMLRDVLHLSLPFTIVMLWRWREMVALLCRYWPLALFAVVTIYQPHSHFFHTGPDNAMRIGMQGVWVLNLMAGYVIIDRLSQRPGSLLRLFVLICPVLWVAMRGFEQYGLLAGGGLWTARVLGACLLALAVAARSRPGDVAGMSWAMRRREP